MNLNSRITLRHCLEIPRILPAALLVFVCAVLMTSGAQAQADPTQLTVIHAFNGADGQRPAASMILASDGNFYGTTANGGADGLGTIFKITPAGAFSTMYSFDGSVGSIPPGNVIQGSDGSLYGTTQNGGASDAGAVFRISLAGAATNLYSFSAMDANGINMDGAQPRATLLQGADGNLYGTTGYGGINGGGTIFKITPAGSLTTLYSFGTPNPGNLDGYGPGAALVQASDGTLYGSTLYGGADQFTSCPAYGGTPEGGTVFGFTTAGALTTLHSFGGISASDGEEPGNLVVGGDGDLYGVTICGGPGTSTGTFFRITSAGALTTIYGFASGTTSGEMPMGALLATPDGTGFYGTTFSGGGQGFGIVYKLTTSGTLTVLYSFSATKANNVNADGANPAAGLVSDATGNLYGTTQSGGPGGMGTVFKLSTPQAVPVPPANPAGGGGGALAWQFLLLLLALIYVQRTHAERERRPDHE